MANQQHSHGEREPARKWSVLIVEDEVLARYTIADYLRDAGYAVVEAADAAEAVAVFIAGQRVDVVFTDVQMPGPMDGLMLVRWVQEHHPGVHVLVTSGHGDVECSAGLIPNETYFPKPYDLEEVTSRIRRIL